MVRSLGLALVVVLLLCSGAGAARPTLWDPFDVLVLPGGKLAVTDRRQGAVFVVDPARQSGRRVARIAEARELERLRNGRLLVTSSANVVAVDVRTGAKRLYARADAPLLGIALAPDGTLYGSEAGQSVVRLRPGPREVLASGLDGAHGITVVPGALILGEAYAGRVLRLDLGTRAVQVLAQGLGNPGFTLPVRSGGFYVSEFLGNRVSRLHPDGRVTTVARVLQPGPLAFDARRRVVGVTLRGTIFRIARGRAQTIYR